MRSWARLFRPIMRMRFRVQPLGMAAFDPVQNSRAPRTQDRQIFSQQHEAEREHPDAEDRKKGKDASEDQQNACGDAQPAAGGSPQKTHSPPQPGWQATDELVQAPIIASRLAVRDLLRTAVR